jgi:hypothetical protein
MTAAVAMNVAWGLEPGTRLEIVKYLAENFSFTSGGALELIRPAFVLLAACVSAWVLASARRRGLAWHAAAAWTAGALLWPQVVGPLYVAFLVWRAPVAKVRPAWRFMLPLLYLAATLGWFGWRFQREFYSLDARLARARQYRLYNWHERAADELRGALALEDDPHTRHLLGVELSKLGRYEEAVAELQNAASRGETDELLYLRLAQLLDELKRGAEAAPSYRAYLASPACQPPETAPDFCALARKRLAALEKTGK